MNREPEDNRPLVTHIVTSLDFGGVERHMELIAAAAHGSSMRHVFVAIGRGGASEQRLKRSGSDVVCLNAAVQIPSLGAVRALLARLKHTRPQIVHTHGAEANFHGLVAAAISRVPVRVGEEIGIPGHSPAARRAFRLVYRTAQRIIGVSAAVREWLIESGEVPAHKAVAIYNPVAIDGQRVDKNQRTGGRLRIGFVGRLEPVKNPSSLIDAVAILKAKGVLCEAWLIGDGSQRAELESRVQELEVQDEVKLLGYQDDPMRRVRECDLFVQPSVSEGFGIALVEAMGCGVPVIATAVGGAPEIIEHDHTGWLIPEGRPELIADGIESALALGVAGLRKVGARARDAVVGRFEPAKYIVTIERLYRDVAAERGIRLPEP